MSGMNGKRRSGSALLVAIGGATLLLGACKDSGLPGKNTPLAAQENSEWRYPVYEKTPAEKKVMELAGHTWQITGATEAVPANLLHAVGTVNGTQLFSLKWDEAPYDHLYAAPVNGRYSVVSNIN